MSSMDIGRHQTLEPADTLQLVYRIQLQHQKRRREKPPEMAFHLATFQIQYSVILAKCPK
jgi:hypothetical protein